MEAKEIYLKIKREITKGLYAYDDQIAAIAKWVESEFEPKKQGKILPIHNVSMNWTEPQKAKEGVSWYNHVILETPIGRAIIEWKSWKESDSYSLTIGNDYVGEGYDLDEAKQLARVCLKTIHDELGQMLY